LENPAPLDFKGFGVAPADRNKVVSFTFEGKTYELTHGDVVIAAITSCTNTSNPNVMIGAGFYQIISLLQSVITYSLLQIFVIIVKNCKDLSKETTIVDGE
jgi:hypothetical protein